MKKTTALSLLITLGLIVIAVGCSSAPATTTTTSVPPTTTTTTSPPPTTATTTTPPPSTTPPPTTTTPPLTTTTTPLPTTTTSAITFGTLASSGQNQFSSTCAVCHGSNGEGTQICPVVMWGSGATLGTYSGQTLFTDAQGMLTYISSKMPLTAPGSLTSQQYTELLAYILLQGNIVQSSTPFNESQLSSISIP